MGDGSLGRLHHRPGERWHAAGFPTMPKQVPSSRRKVQPPSGPGSGSLVPSAGSRLVSLLLVLTSSCSHSGSFVKESGSFAEELGSFVEEFGSGSLDTSRWMVSDGWNNGLWHGCGRPRT